MPVSRRAASLFPLSAISFSVQKHAKDSSLVGRRRRDHFDALLRLTEEKIHARQLTTEMAVDGFRCESLLIQWDGAIVESGSEVRFGGRRDRVQIIGIGFEGPPGHEQPFHFAPSEVLNVRQRPNRNERIW